MATVTKAILDLLGGEIKNKEYQLLQPGAESVRRLLAEVQRQIRDELLSVSGESYTAYHLKQNLASIERYLQGFEAAAGRELAAAIEASWTAGGDLPFKAVREAGLIFTGLGHIPSSVLRSLQEFASHKISGLAADAFNRVRGELTLGILGQKTPWQVTQAIIGEIKDTPIPERAGRPIFKSIEERAEVITRTEMGRAFSMATHEGLKQAAASVPGLEKQWWHAGHPKQPRQNHLALHGQHVPVDKKFLIGSLAIDYPRAPTAPVSEVIRCGCEVMPWHPNWGKPNGEEIKLPIFNERGEQIARRGPRTGREEDLTGKFKLGQVGPRS